MVSFDYKPEQIETRALSLEYFLVPWDTAIFARPVAAIERVEIRDTQRAALDYRLFQTWVRENGIEFCSCRIPHDGWNESMFLQSVDFRFIELNYRPELKIQPVTNLPEEGISIEKAGQSDKDILAEMAFTIFRYGRIHQDPRLGAALGNRRYKHWLLNSFEQAERSILKCSRDGEIVAFFVVEYPSGRSCFWSLVGLAPGLQGQGLGRKVWRAMLHWHRQQGVEVVSTSISSLNDAVVNLYVHLGFRFPKPGMTFHWHAAHSDSPG
jgi:GNAT superfamily N-acetyltransferase